MTGNVLRCYKYEIGPCTLSEAGPSIDWALDVCSASSSTNETMTIERNVDCEAEAAKNLVFKFQTESA